MKKLFVLNSCCECPNVKTKLTKGFGYALDYMCGAMEDKHIVGYVEWDSEKPQPGAFPKWCPLKTYKPRKNTEQK